MEVKRAVELGCTHFDTAQIYGHFLGFLFPFLRNHVRAVECELPVRL